MSTLIQFAVVICEIYCVVCVIGFFLGLVNAGWRQPFFYGNLGGSIGSFIFALAVVIVFGHHNLGF
jgi:hypothetical protein